MNPETRKWALFKDEKQVGDSDSSHFAVVMDGLKIGAVLSVKEEFWEDRTVVSFADGYSIAEVSDA